MRTGASQIVPTSSPKVVITINGTDSYYSEGSNSGVDELICKASTDEQAWGGEYIVELDNSDESLNSKDYEGKSVDLKFCFTTETAESLPPLYVLRQQFTSQAGKLKLILYCVDMWHKVGANKVSFTNASFNQTWQTAEYLDSHKMPDQSLITDVKWSNIYEDILTNGDRTAYQIIQALATSCDITVSLTDNDGYVQIIKPPISVDDALSGMRQVLEMTKSYLKLTSGGSLTVYQPDNHASVYTFSTMNMLINSLTDESVVVPNRLKFWTYNATGTAWISNADGTGEDSISAGRLGWITRNFILSTLDIHNLKNQSELNSIANGAIAKLQAEASMGWFTAPMHCTLDLFDKVTIEDTRYVSTRTTTGYVHRIKREYASGVYLITVYLGGATSGFVDPNSGAGKSKTLAEIEVKSPALQNSATTDKALLPIKTDVVFSAKLVSGFYDDDIEWTSGTIWMADGSTQSISAGSLHLANTNKYFIYCDLDDATPATLKSSQTFTDAIYNRCLWIAVAKKGATVVDKAWIAAASDNKEFFVSELSAINANMGLLTAGEIRLGTGTPGSNFTGLRLYKSGTTYKLVGQSDGVDQAYFDSDGSLKTGLNVGNYCKLDINGLSVYGQLVSFYDNPSISGTRKGIIGFDGTQLLIVSLDNVDLRLNSNTHVKCTIAPTEEDDIVRMGDVNVLGLHGVVDDPAPQLGGDLDSNSKDILMKDSGVLIGTLGRSLLLGVNVLSLIGDNHSVWIGATGTGHGVAIVTDDGDIEIGAGGGKQVKIYNVINPTNPQDVATKKYVDDHSGGITGTGVNTYIPMWNGTTSLTSSSFTESDIANLAVDSHDQGTDTTLGDMSADINMNGHTLTDLSVLKLPSTY